MAWNNKEKTELNKLKVVGGDQTVATSNNGIITDILTTMTGKNQANAQSAFNLGASAPVTATPPAVTNEVTDNENLLRMVKLTDYENDRYKKHKETMYVIFIFCVLLAIILYVFQAFSLPYLNIVLGILGAIFIIVLFTRFWDSFTRDRFNYDKYDFSYDKKFMIGKTAKNKSPSILGTLSAQICPAATTVDTAAASAASEATAATAATSSTTGGSSWSALSSLGTDSNEYKVGDVTVKDCVFDTSTEMKECYDLDDGKGWHRAVGCPITGGVAASGEGKVDGVAVADAVHNPCTLCKNTPAFLCNLEKVKAICGANCGTELSITDNDGKFSFDNWVRNVLKKQVSKTNTAPLTTKADWGAWWTEKGFPDDPSAVKISDIDFDKLGGFGSLGAGDEDAKYNILYTMFYKILNKTGLTTKSMPDILIPKEGERLGENGYLPTCNTACNPMTEGSDAYYTSSNMPTFSSGDNLCYSSVDAETDAPGSCDVTYDSITRKIKCRCKTELISDPAFVITKDKFANWISTYA